MEGELSSVSAQWGEQERVENYRPVAIINVGCKLFMMVLRERINGWVEIRDESELGILEGAHL